MRHLTISIYLAVALLSSGSPAAFAARAADTGVRLCTVGYLPELPKIATVVGAEKSDAFQIVDQTTGETVYSGKLGPLSVSAQTNERVCVADFTTLRRTGTYVVRISGLPDSAAFVVAPNALNRSLVCVMVGFYGQRCGQAVRFDWNGQSFVHAACHFEDAWLDYHDPAKKGQRKEATGGWHDAGDYGKYSVNAAFTTAMMLQAWEYRADALKRLQLPFIPEHGGALPDYLAELKFNLDWLLAMQSENGEVAHKLTTLGFGAMAMMPEDDRAQRFFTPNSRSATLNFAAVGCIAARVFRGYDAAYADTWSAAAKRAWEAAQKMPDANPDTAAFKTGNYFAPTANDYKWALIEVRLAFGDASLKPEERAQFADAIASPNRMFTESWDWGNGYNLGLFSWLFSEEARKNPAQLARLRKDLIDSADTLVRTSESHAYGRGLTVYFWGVNGALARAVMNLAAAYRVTGDARYRDTAFAQLAYLYGRNPFGRSFVTGDGDRPPLFPHHRPTVGDKVDAPWPGHLVGGPTPTELDWFDEVRSYQTNEIAINWDGALAYALAVFYRP